MLLAVLANVFQGDPVGVVPVRLTEQFSNVRGVVIQCVVFTVMLSVTGLLPALCPTVRVCVMCVCVPIVCDIQLRRGRERTQLYQARRLHLARPRESKLSKRWSKTVN